MTDVDVKQEASLARAEGYLEGYKAALRLYAWWKDGVQYVGCGAHTLKEVLEELEKGRVNSKDRKPKKQEQKYEEPDDGHMSLGEEQAMRGSGIT